MRIGRAICAMSDRPTAVVTTLDRLAVGILEGIRLSGYSVPNDISIVGFDNWELLEYVQPKLTTVLQDLERRPNAWSRLLMHRIRGERSSSRTSRWMYSCSSASPSEKSEPQGGISTAHARI